MDVLVDVDVEARGYLNEGDFKNSFNQRVWHTPLTVELIELLQQQHQTPKEAYQWICNHRDLDYSQFVKAIEQLIGKQNNYSKKDYERLWEFLAGKDKVIAWSRF